MLYLLQEYTSKLHTLWFYQDLKLFQYYALKFNCLCILGGIGLITNQEVDTSDITLEKSQEFLKHEAQEDDDLVADFIIDDDDPVSYDFLIISFLSFLSYKVTNI